MIYCGIDASSTCTGVAIFNDLNLIYYNKFRSTKKYDCWERNLRNILDQVEPIINEYKVDKIFMEDVPQYANKGSRGGAILAPLIALGGTHMAFYNKLVIDDGYEIDFKDVYEWRKPLGFLEGKRDRESMKEKAVNYANEKFGLNLYFTKGSKSIKNDDDIAEAICIVWSQIKPIEVIKRSFGKG